MDRLEEILEDLGDSVKILLKITANEELKACLLASEKPELRRIVDEYTSYQGKYNYVVKYNDVKYFNEVFDKETIEYLDVLKDDAGGLVDNIAARVGGLDKLDDIFTNLHGAAEPKRDDMDRNNPSTPRVLSDERSNLSNADDDLIKPSKETSTQKPKLPAVDRLRTGRNDSNKPPEKDTQRKSDARLEAWKARLSLKAMRPRAEIIGKA